MSKCPKPARKNRCLCRYVWCSGWTAGRLVGWSAVLYVDRVRACVRMQTGDRSSTAVPPSVTVLFFFVHFVRPLPSNSDWPLLSNT